MNARAQLRLDGEPPDPLSDALERERLPRGARELAKAHPGRLSRALRLAIGEGTALELEELAVHLGDVPGGPDAALTSVLRFVLRRGLDQIEAEIAEIRRARRGQLDGLKDAEPSRHEDRSTTHDRSTSPDRTHPQQG